MKKQFGVISNNKCETSDVCRKGTYCTYNNVFGYNICESCCHANSALNKGGQCEKCTEDSHKIGECPDFECTVAST